MEKVAVVTGSSSGIGFETSLALAREGYFTYATMRDLKKADEIQKITDKFNKIAKLDEAELARLDELENLKLTKKNQKELEELEKLKAKREAQIAAEDEFNQLILEKDEAFLNEKLKLLNQQQVEALKIVQSMGENIGQEFINILNDQTKTAKDFMKFTIDLIIQTLEKLTYQKLGDLNELDMKAEAVESRFKKNDEIGDL